MELIAFLIVAVLLVGGVWFLTRDKEDEDNGVSEEERASTPPHHNPDPTQGAPKRQHRD